MCEFSSPRGETRRVSCEGGKSYSHIHPRRRPAIPDYFAPALVRKLSYQHPMTLDIDQTVQMLALPYLEGTALPPMSAALRSWGSGVQIHTLHEVV